MTDSYSFVNGNAWEYHVCTGYNLIEYKAGNGKKTVTLTHGLFSSHEMYRAERDTFLQCAEGLPVYTYLFPVREDYAEIRLTTDKDANESRLCGKVNAQTAGMITGKSVVGFYKDGTLKVNRAYKEYVSDRLVTSYY